MLKIVEAYRAYSGFQPSEIFLVEEEAASVTEYEKMYDEGYTLIDEDGIIHGFFDNFFDAERKLCESVGGVSIGPDYLAIYDEHGEEIVHWTEQEWKEDDSLTLNLANAVRLYYTHGPNFIKQVLGKQGI